MISEGMIDQGVSIVKAIRDRYRGYNRNPWNEIECGSNYARSMASFALMPIYAGYKFAMQDGTIGFSPVTDGNFRSIWAVDAAWGRYEKSENQTTLTICSGELPLRALEVPYLREVQSVIVDGVSCAFVFDNGRITLNAAATQSIVISGSTV